MFWKKGNADSVDVCTICLHDVWDCICPHDSLEDSQFVTVGKHTQRVLADIRRKEKDAKAATPKTDD